MPSHRELANAIRFLAVDAIQKANSGHPGMPLGMADIAEVLWNEFLRHNPKNSHWVNRDRFILSNGHGSMLLYSLLHLTGYDLSIDELKNFRQLHSKTPGHPEFGLTPGVETTTGPLGQGLGNAVGMALAEKILATQFNKKDFNIVDHYTYVFCGDGCLMEGISHEVCSLAGAWKLNKLILFWDDNKISIDGDTKDWFSDDTAKRFESYHWHVIRDVDGHDAEAVKKAILEAKKSDKPTLIDCRTTIGFGSPNKAGKAQVHGAPLGDDEIKLTREKLNWKYQPFEIPKEIYSAYNACARGEKLENDWQQLLDNYQQQYPELAKEFKRRLSGELPMDFEKIIQKIIKSFLGKPEKIATRKSSQKVLDILAPTLPELLGGSADLSESNLTLWAGAKELSPQNFDANYIHYGVREMGMSAIMNGLALHGEFIPYGGTFLVFYTYASGAVRMTAMMKQRVIFIYSHDSIGLGEDGPTHQPIEQLEALRAVPNMSVWRPADGVETAIAWEMAIKRQNGPSALVLTRQGVPPLPQVSVDKIRQGGYIIKDCTGTPDSIIIATGSEVSLALQAAEVLTKRGKNIRVVSMPSVDTFAKQDRHYRESVLPFSIKAKVAIEASSSARWHQWVGDAGKIIGIDQFGKSAPTEKLFHEFGFTVEHVVKIVEDIL